MYECYELCIVFTFELFWSCSILELSFNIYIFIFFPSPHTHLLCAFAVCWEYHLNSSRLLRWPHLQSLSSANFAVATLESFYFLEWAKSVLASGPHSCCFCGSLLSLTCFHPYPPFFTWLILPVLQLSTYMTLSLRIFSWAPSGRPLPSSCISISSFHGVQFVICNYLFMYLMSNSLRRLYIP